MRRGILIFAIVSFVIAAIVCAFFVRSQFISDVAFRASWAGQTVDGFDWIETRYLSTTPAGIEYGYANGNFPPEIVPAEELSQGRVFGFSHSDPMFGMVRSAAARSQAHLFGFKMFQGSAEGGAVQWEIFVIPWWVVMLAAFAIPAKVVWFWIVRHRRRNKFLCFSCGYDLRETPHCCPECGASQ